MRIETVRADNMVSVMAATALALYRQLEFFRSEFYADAVERGREDKYIPRSQRARIGDAVRQMAQKMKTEITAPDLLRGLTESGIEVVARRPGSNIGNILRRLKAEGYLIEVEPGAGRRPTRYRLADG